VVRNRFGWRIRNGNLQKFCYGFLELVTIDFTVTCTVNPQVPGSSPGRGARIHSLRIIQLRPPLRWSFLRLGAAPGSVYRKSAVAVHEAKPKSVGRYKSHSGKWWRL